ncbi:DUF6550 family protein [Lacrimispora algidixylanolytica]|uniref:Uncharacterized protein n=1 Tax=Lacrimispora algidixylanolytica TaxID=94868 RepID=A0A419T4B2_9FIRM|nr:DUF6550 family protein [Lacrimispora algidixylanolytica]RKD32390.1 hypothetical protein BET01_03340 [Lacrimispora algidixylanolytica]
MKLSDRKKKWCIVIGISVLCIILVIAIVSRFKKETLVEAEATTAAMITTTDSPTISTLSVTGEETTTPVTTQEVSVQPTSTEAEIQNMDTGDSSGIEQSIQPEVTKPAEPLNEAKKDPTKTPSGEKVTTAVQAEESEVKSTTAPTQSSSSESEDNHEGKIYVPGFGWVEDNGGSVSGTTAEDMFENGNKIGSMD